MTLHLSAALKTLCAQGFKSFRWTLQCSQRQSYSRQPEAEAA